MRSYLQERQYLQERVLHKQVAMLRERMRLPSEELTSPHFEKRMEAAVPAFAALGKGKSLAEKINELYYRVTGTEP